MADSLVVPSVIKPQTPVWKTDICLLFQVRDRNERTPYEAIIRNYQTLLAENHSLQRSVAQNTTSGTDKQEALEAELQLTLKRNSEQAESLLSLLHEKNEAARITAEKVKEAQILREENNKIQAQLNDALGANAFLKSEVASLCQQRDSFDEQLTLIQKKLKDSESGASESKRMEEWYQTELLKYSKLIDQMNRQIQQLLDELLVLKEQNNSDGKIDKGSKAVTVTENEDKKKPEEAKPLIGSGIFSGLLRGISSVGIGVTTAMTNGSYMDDDDDDDDGEAFVCLSGGSDHVPTSLRRSFAAHKEGVNNLKFSYQGSMFGTAGSDGIIKIWDALTSTIVKSFHGPPRSAIMSVDISPSNDLVLGGTSDNTVWVWGFNEDYVRHTLTGHRGPVGPACFSLDNTSAVSGGRDRCIKVWDLDRGVCSTTFICGSKCNDLCFLSKVMCSAHFDKSVRVYDIRSGKELHRTSVHAGQVTSVTASPDQTYLLTNSRDNTLRLLDVRMSFDEVKVFRDEKYRNGVDSNKACFSGGGRYAIAGGSDGTLFLWDTISGSLKTSLSDEQSSNVVCGCAWSPYTSQVLMAYKGDGNVSAWD